VSICIRLVIPSLPFESDICGHLFLNFLHFLNLLLMFEKCSRVGVHMHINTYGRGVFFLYFYSRKEYMAGFNNCTSLAYTVSDDFVGGFREVSA
jgi:hypothetical protein